MKSIQNVQFPKVKMSKQQVTSLIEASQKGDKEARDTLVNANMRLVHAVCKRFLNRDIEYDDLFSIGVIGLLKCIDKFNTAYNVEFSTYAVPMMMGEIQRFLRDDQLVRFSRSAKEVGYRIVKEDWHDRDPKEIADELEVTLSMVLSAFEFLRNRNVKSTEDIVTMDGERPITVGDRIHGDINDGWEDQFIFREVIDRLEPRDQTIIRMRYYDDKTQAEVAVFLKLSQVQISRLEKKALAQLKEMYEEEKDMAKAAVGDRQQAIELLKKTSASFNEISRRTGVPVGSLSKLCKDHRPEELRKEAAARADRGRNIASARAARAEKKKQEQAKKQESSIKRPQGVQIMQKLVLPSSSKAKDDKQVTKVEASEIPDVIVQQAKEIREKRNVAPKQEVQLTPIPETKEEGLSSTFTYGINGSGSKQEVMAQLTLALDMIKLLGDNDTINFKLSITK